MPKTEFTESDFNYMRELAKETVEKFIGRDMIDEWQSLKTISEKVWEKRFFDAFHSTLREYFDWFDGVHQDCPYCTQFELAELVCPVCNGRGWIE